jgi:predicted dehydrogenase
LVLQINPFADVIGGKCPPLVSGREGMRSLAVIEAILASAAQGVRVELT